MITIYIDVLFMINFIINILIVEGTGVIMGEDTKWYRTLIASIVGALYSVAVFFPNLKFIQSFVMKIILSGVMVICAFKIKARKKFIRLWGGFYMVSFIFGGAIIAIMSMTSLGAKMGAVYSNGIIYFNVPWKLLLLVSSGTYFLIFAFGRIRRKKIAKEAVGRRLSIYINGIRIDTKAIIDTGNSLCDPITGYPVIVCEYDEMKSLIPCNEGESIIDKMHEKGLKVRLIPFSSIGKEKGLMPAFLPDMIKIDEYEAKGCIVGISLTKLSATEDYHALLNPMITVK